MPRAEEYGSSSGSMGVTSVTASLPLNSSGGSTPNISLSGVVGVANGGTGSATGSAASLNNLPAAELVGNVPVGTLSVALSTPPAIGGTTPAAGTFTVYVDGSVATGTARQLRYTSATASGSTAGLLPAATASTHAVLTSLDAGAHTIEARWSRLAGTARAVGTSRRLDCVELGQ